MNNEEKIKELANAIQRLAESIYYAELGNKLPYSELVDIMVNMKIIAAEKEDSDNDK